MSTNRVIRTVDCVLFIDKSAFQGVPIRGAPLIKVKIRNSLSMVE